MPRLLLLALVVALLTACSSFPRRLEYTTLRSDALRDTYAEVAVYVPPVSGEGERLPVVIFLHGGGDSPDCLDRHGIAARLDEAIRAGRVPPAIIVVPQGDLSFWTNWYDGSRRYEDWAVDEVIRAVGRRHPILPCPEGCHLVGVSMGAEGAIRIALHRPGAFASVSSISGPAMDTDRRIAFLRDPLINIVVPTHHVFGPPEPRSRIEADDPFVQWTSPADLAGTRLFLAWGTRDRDAIRLGGAALHDHLASHAIPHTLHVFEGEHTWRDWGPVIEEALRTQLRSSEGAAVARDAP